MTFRLTCPVCGRREVGEFTYGGPERGPAPHAREDGADEAGGGDGAGDGGTEGHFRWAQFRLNLPRTREEWWHHAAGCGIWFQTRRDPATNREERGEGAE